MFFIIPFYKLLAQPRRKKPDIFAGLSFQPIAIFILLISFIWLLCIRSINVFLAGHAPSLRLISSITRLTTISRFLVAPRTHTGLSSAMNRLQRLSKRIQRKNKRTFVLLNSLIWGHQGRFTMGRECHFGLVMSMNSRMVSLG